MNTSRKRFEAVHPSWIIAACILSVFLLVPCGAVFFYAVTGEATEWAHISSNLLGSYIGNTLLLIAGVSAGVLILGVSAAALVTFVNFPGRKFFEWALILPLSIPAYLLAFSYAEICGFKGWMSAVFGSGIDLLNSHGAIFIFTLALYPYVYLPAKTFFKSEAFRLMEAGSSLGKTQWQSFIKLVLPLSYPIIGGGLFLSAMEVLNDFGVVKYFGVPTFTVGIFRAWTGFADISSALRLSCILLLVVFSLKGMSTLLKNSHSRSQPGTRYIREKEQSNLVKLSALIFCALCLFFAFLLPVAQMVSGVLATAGRVINSDFAAALFNSFKLAGTASLLVLVCTLLITYARRVNRNNAVANWSAALAVLGYSIPGAVIALGVLAPVTSLDKWIYGLSGSTDWLISSTLITLIFALVVRYAAVSVNTLSSGYETLSPNLVDASASLGSGTFKNLLKIDLPLMKNYLIAAFILVFVDVLKELPLTMILRPFNFETLAIKAFNLASDELLREASNASVLIVLTGLIPIFILNRLMKNAGS